MPEYRPSGKRRLSQEELMREYRGETPEKRRKKQVILSPAKRKEAKIIHEAKTAMPPVSPVRQQRNEQHKALEQERLRNQKKRNVAKKAKRKKRKRNMLLYDIIFIVLIVGTLAILSVTVLFNISEITINGNEKYTDDQVIAASGVNIGDNLIRLDIGSAENGILQNLIYVDDVNVSRSFPNRLTVDITTAVPMAAIYTNASYYVISYNNKLLDIAKSAPQNTPTVDGIVLSASNEVGKQIIKDEIGKLDITEEIINAFNEYKLNEPLKINISDAMNIKITYDNRLQIDFGAPTQLKEKMYALDVLVREEIGTDDKLTIMLTNPERVVTRPIYESDTTTAPEETTAPDVTTDENGSLPEDTTASETEAPEETTAE